MSALRTSRRGRLAAKAAALLLPLAGVFAVPAAASADTVYCYNVVAADPSGWIYSWGVVDSCVQPVEASIHLREDISWAPDREVSNDVRPGVTGAFMQAGAQCFWTPGDYHSYFLEARVRVNGSYVQKVQSNRWTIDFYC